MASRQWFCKLPWKEKILGIFVRMVCIKLTSMECPFEPLCCKTTLIIRSRAFLGIYTFFWHEINPADISLHHHHHHHYHHIVIIINAICVCVHSLQTSLFLSLMSVSPAGSSIFLKLNLPKSGMGKNYLRLAWLLKAQLIQPFLELGLNRVQWMEVFLRCALCMCNRPCCLC